MYSVGLEIGASGWTYAWVLDLPGCFARGPSPEETLRALPPRIERFLARLSEFEPVDRPPRIEVKVAEEVHGECPVHRGDTRALFAWDRAAPTAEEFERGLRWMGHNRRALLSLVEGLSAEVLDRQAPGDAEREFHDARAPSIRRILRHVAGAEYWYLSRIAGPGWLSGFEPGDMFAALAIVREAAVPKLREVVATTPDRVVELSETTWSGTFTEGWTLRKVLRRALWHEAFHVEEIRRHLEGRSGDRAAVGTA